MTQRCFQLDERDLCGRAPPHGPDYAVARAAVEDLVPDAVCRGIQRLDLLLALDGRPTRRCGRLTVGRGRRPHPGPRKERLQYGDLLGDGTGPVSAECCSIDIRQQSPCGGSGRDRATSRSGPTAEPGQRSPPHRRPASLPIHWDPAGDVTCAVQPYVVRHVSEGVVRPAADTASLGCDPLVFTQRVFCCWVTGALDKPHRSSSEGASAFPLKI